MTNNNPPSNKKKKNGGKRHNKRKLPGDEKFEWQKATKTLTFWALIVIVAWILFRQMNLAEQPEINKSYSQYLKLLESGQIDAAEIIDRDFHGQLNDGSTIVTTLPFINKEMITEWDSLRIDFQFKDKTTSWIGYLITSILPWIVIIGIWLYLMRRMQGGGSRGVFSFGKSKAKLMMETKLKVTFSDVAGCDEAKEELKEIIEFLKDPKRFSRLGGRIPKGALLLGPPGTGKTLLARAVAGEADVPFFSMSGADFVEMFVGVGASRVRDLFEQGKKSAPCIIFIDEIDAVGRHRGAGLGGGHDEREQTLNQLLVEMDGFESNEGVILIAATNRPDVLDPALIRPGRFDRQIIVDSPDARGREGILKVHARKIPLASDVKLDILAKGTPGLSGADLANLVNEAALLAARRNAKRVFMPDFEDAKDKVMMGTERRSLIISEDEKNQTAYHEAGHVLVAKLTPGADPVHKVTIIPRGKALGLTHYLPIDEKHNYSRTYLNQTLVHLMGGRAAELIIFRELSTGAGNDIERATGLARKMVCEWGMSDKIGPITMGKKNGEVFLGKDITQSRDYSEQSAHDIDYEIKRIVTTAQSKSERLIRDNLSKLQAIAKALLEREILDGAEIDMVLRGETLPPVSVKKTKYTKKPRYSGSDKRRSPSSNKQSRPTQNKPKQDTENRSAPAINREHSERQRPTRIQAKSKPVAHHEPQKPRIAKKEPARQKPESRQRSSYRSRNFELASSRDPENRRPTSRELAKISPTVEPPREVKNEESKSSKPRVTHQSSRTKQSTHSTSARPDIINKPTPEKKDNIKVVNRSDNEKPEPRIRSYTRRKPTSTRRDNAPKYEKLDSKVSLGRVVKEKIIEKSSSADVKPLAPPKSDSKPEKRDSNSD